MAEAAPRQRDGLVEPTPQVYPDRNGANTVNTSPADNARHARNLRRLAAADVIAKLLQAGVTPRWWSKLAPLNEGARVPLTRDDLIDAHTFDWDAGLEGLVA